MSKIHSCSTGPEVRLRLELWKRGFRYRINDKRLPGSPDIVFPKYHAVVFVHGCFWHGHIDCKRFRRPKSNSDYWENKVTRNRQRDERVENELVLKGWKVIVVWECELEKKSYSSTVERVINEIIQD